MDLGEAVMELVVQVVKGELEAREEGVTSMSTIIGIRLTMDGYPILRTFLGAWKLMARDASWTVMETIRRRGRIGCAREMGCRSSFFLALMILTVAN